MGNNRAGVDKWGSVGDDWGVDGVGDNGSVDSVGDNGMGHDLAGDGVSDSDGWSVSSDGSGVGHVLDDTVSVVGVGHGLDTTVGEVDGVGAGGGVSVSLFSLGKVGSAVVIGNSVVVGVHWRLSEVWGSSVSWGGNNHTSWESTGDSEESSGTDESLEKIFVTVKPKTFHKSTTNHFASDQWIFF